MQAHQTVVIDSLKDSDYSVKKKALNLLYVLCDITNAKDVVEELVLNLTTAESIIKEVRKHTLHYTHYTHYT